MSPRTVQLVLHYDGTDFSGWQRQPVDRTIQGTLELALERLCGSQVPVTGAGRTDAGVHARGQAAGIRVPERWTPVDLRRALNAVLPADVWVAHAYEMQDDFHARYSAVARHYGYYVGLDDEARSPFRRRTELSLTRRMDTSLLHELAASLCGEHAFYGFAVRGTAPDTDDHRCNVRVARWIERPGGLVFERQAHRVLHHMVRFLVGTMLDVAAGRRPLADFDSLLRARDNTETSSPAPAHALFLERVEYPTDLYLESHESLSRLGAA